MQVGDRVDVHMKKSLCNQPLIYYNVMLTYMDSTWICIKTLLEYDDGTTTTGYKSVMIPISNICAVILLDK